MKTSVYLFAIMALYACQPAVTFSEAQPPGSDNLAEFPEKLRGSWFCADDSSFILIGNNTFVRKFPLSEMTVSEKGDSVLKTIVILDTLFQMRDDKVLRKFRQRYFMNTFRGDMGWEVIQIRTDKKRLQISSIHSKEDIETIKTISESTDTLPPYRFKTNRKQFRKIFKDEGIGEKQWFVRVEE